MRVFLTGSNGFIGSHLMAALKGDGFYVETDMRNFDKYAYHRVIHLAAKTTISAEFDADMFYSNIILAHKVMSTPHKLIYASSCSAAHLTNPYAYTKRFNEHLGSIHSHAIGLRFHNVYGPGNNKGVVKFLMEQKSGSVITVRGPKLIRDYIYIDDVVAWIMHLVVEDYTPGLMDIGTGKGTRTIDLVDKYMRLTKKWFTINSAPHGINEPEEMVAYGAAFPYIDLEQGLKKTIEYAKEDFSASADFPARAI